MIRWLYYWFRLKWLQAKEPYYKWRMHRASDRLDRVMEELRVEIELQKERDAA